jgi:hypothetical protein
MFTQPISKAKYRNFENKKALYLELSEKMLILAPIYYQIFTTKHLTFEIKRE